MLKNECVVSQSWDPNSGDPEPTAHPFQAIWDTGATHSVITQSVVDACGLTQIGLTQVSHAAGTTNAEVYLVNIVLPNKLGFFGVRVTKGELRDAGMLIGMDIINRGDFAVTNKNGVTKFSFRTPSSANIDFAAEIRRDNLLAKSSSKPSRAKRSSKQNKKKKKKKKKKRK